MRYVSSVCTRTIDDLPPGYDMTGCKTDHDKVYIPYKIPIYEEDDKIEDVIADLDRLAKQEYGEVLERNLTIRGERGEPSITLFERGDPVGWWMLVTVATKLGHQQAAVNARRPTALGKLSDDDYAKIANAVAEHMGSEKYLATATEMINYPMKLRAFVVNYFKENNLKIR